MTTTSSCSINVTSVIIANVHSLPMASPVYTLQPGTNEVD